MAITAEELLAGSDQTHEVDLPAELFARSTGPTDSGQSPADTRMTPGDTRMTPGDTRMTLRPLTVKDVQRVARASHGQQEMAATLMIQLAAVEPTITAEQAARLPAGVARYLVDEINEISGMTTPRDRLGELVQAPLARACFVLADEFGWTAEDVSAMTIGQILLYLEMLGQSGAVA